MPHWRDFLDADAPRGALLPWKKVEPRVGISRTTAWRMQKTGDFPTPYVVSPGRVAYREAEIDAWKDSRGPRTAGARRTQRPRAHTQENVQARPEPLTWSPAPPQALNPEPAPPPTSLTRSDGAGVRRHPARTRRKALDRDQMTFEF
ncbi:MAG: helix-turn-helix transcriptional regulator [Phenylobacterium sp.]|uniref:helix-turn-helix transcriptional regulator n=1 Tax=Phenylobacterium sp. TaxID=1871053 RepID=UPI00391C65C5